MKLFDRTSIKNMTLKNRIFMGPMGSSTEDTDGGFTQASIDYYASRAKGGCAMVMLSACATKEFEGRLLYCLDSQVYANRFERFTEEMHSYDTKVCVQLLAGFGRVGGVQPGTFVPTSASAVPYKWNPNILCRELTVEEVHRIVDAYGKAAGLAKRYGADCVEIHGYGGYLIDQFMSSAWNKRTDEYGGSLENRMRFPFELIDAVRANCGSDFPILFKMTPNHYFDEGRTMDEGIQIAHMLEEYGVDALQIDVGCYDSLDLVIPTAYYEGENLDLKAAKEIKAEVNIPVFMSGQLDDPNEVRDILEKNEIDYVVIGRGILADPAWANKVRFHQEEDIVPCIRCNEGCLGRVSLGKRIGCAVNPLTGKEATGGIRPISETKKILVIGAGPAGLSAALTAKKQNHQVEIYEATDQIGGNLIPAAAPQSKKQMRKLIAYYEHQIEKYQIPVHFHHRMTVQEIEEYQADLVIIATGSRPIVPHIPGLKENTYVLADEILTGKKQASGQCAVIGGGLVGIETGLYLKENGIDCTVYEMADRILKDVIINNNLAGIHKAIERHQLDCITNACLQEVKDHRMVTVVNDEVKEIAFDTLILAVGYQSNNELVNALDGNNINYTVVGDCCAPSKVLNAVWDGYNAIRAYHENILSLK